MAVESADGSKGGLSIGGSVAGGSVAGGSVAGGSVAGGSVAGGSVADRAAAAATAGFAALSNDLVASLLELALRDPSTMVRGAALGALVRQSSKSSRGALADAASESWRAALGDTEADLRRRACELAPVIAGDARFIDALLVVGLLDDADPLVAEAACWSLGELGDSAVNAGAVTALVALILDPPAQSPPTQNHAATTIEIGHPDALVREAAVAALGALGHPEGLRAVLAGCSDKPAIRRRAVLALAAFEGPEVEAAIELALSDRDWQTAQAAEDLHGRFPSQDCAD